MTSNELEIFKQSILDDVRVMMQTTGQVTQYIGARYVPLFADPLEWSDTKEYEPLTIVLHQGNSFTSRQFVPKGIGIDNADFWASTGNYNAQIEQYRQETQKVKSQLDGINADITTINKKLPLIGDKCVVFGNSYTVGANASKGMGALIGSLFKEWKMFWSDGVGFMPYTVGGGAITITKNFNSLVEQAESEMPEEKRDEITDVFFVMAMGDTRYASYNEDIISGGSIYTQTVLSTIKNAKAIFPNAIIHVMNAEMKAGNYNAGYTTAYDNWRINRNFYKWRLAYGVDWMGMLGFTYWGNASMVQKDNYHPTDEGYSYLFPAFVNALHGRNYYGTGEYANKGEFRLTVSSADTPTNDVTNTETTKVRINFDADSLFDRNDADITQFTDKQIKFIMLSDPFGLFAAYEYVTAILTNNGKPIQVLTMLVNKDQIDSSHPAKTCLYRKLDTPLTVENGSVGLIITSALK